ncbi:hypothetical protein Ddye_022140 [Dipteronia dyeriana]|uniref:Uncharacterized protein n=1 Tax=Dipteronia dyeriana TaxID=168575 RepID=A0AAD9U3Y6_9ROSI|nr:hypothetical protein Ddye_022140 [Dipteronia dyeriana]
MKVTSQQARCTQFLDSNMVPLSPRLLDFRVPPYPKNSMLVQASEGQPTWCIAKPYTDEKRLLANIDFSCIQAALTAVLSNLGANATCLTTITRMLQSS